MTTFKTALLFVAALAFTTTTTAQDQTLLLRDPDLSDRHIAFVYAGDIWIALRDGSNPQRLTSHPAAEFNPTFSPDGQSLAFSAGYEGNTDVYTLSINGGQPKRLTWHPGYDRVIDWTSDGSEVAFTSRRETAHGRSAQLFHVSTNGGLPEKQMEARIFHGRYQQNAERLAYHAFGPAYNGLFGGSSGWKGYRGGASPSITIMNLRGDSVVDVPGERVNDIEPLWVGDSLYFVSDRDNKIFNLHRFDESSKRVEKVSVESVWDIRAADAHGDTIIYEAGGRLKLLDTVSGGVEEIKISINPDLPQLRRQWKDASKIVQSTALSPSGKRVVMVARGDVFTVPVKDGSTRNLTRTDGGREYTALWSADGKQIAYIQATAVQQQLVVASQTGLDDERRWPLADGDFNTLLDWSDDGERIVFHDHRLQLQAIDLNSGRRTRISTGARRDQIEVDFAPGGRWLAYTEEQANFNRDLMLYDFERDRSVRVSNGFADVSSPVFSPDGKYVYFAASTNSGPQQVGLDLSSQERPYRAGIYALVLATDGQSPVTPKSGDEEQEENANGENEDSNGKKDGEDDQDIETRVDLEGITNRIVALPVAERNYDDLNVAEDGTLYYVQAIQPGSFNAPPEQQEQTENQLMRFDFKEREAASILPGVIAATFSADGKHVLTTMADRSFQVGEIAEKLELKPLDTSGLRMLIDPRREWTQIFDEAWRMEQAYFYDPAMHGLDWQAVYERYRPLVDHVGRREDLSALIVEMIGEMQVGHNRSGGGDIHRENGPKAGLLGGDFRINNGRYQVAKIYSGENWNPFLQAPLAAPRLDIDEGNYILAIDGHELTAQDNIFEHLQGTAGKQVTLKIADRANAPNGRDVVVNPATSEQMLRLWHWVESNRQAVSEATDDKVGYVYLPNTAGAGYTFFNRMFFAQVDKDAMIIDERSNGGGQAANYITDVLNRTYLSGWKDRDGMIFNTPGGAIYGPKVMLIDQDAGSGGDFLPYSFREMKIGPLIGKRTWGGLIGISVNPQLMDGGFLSVPFFRFFDTAGNWSVENEGVAPDIDIALDPIAANQGRDTQLERAIEEVMQQPPRANVPPRQAPPYPKELGR